MSAGEGGLLPPQARARLANLQLFAREVVEGLLSGLHKSPYHGHSVEFAEYREYVPGDDLRFFDWKAFGKTDRLYIKKFHSETNTALNLLVDRSASMGFSTGAVSKLRYAAALAAALAYVATRQQDAPGLVTFDADEQVALPPKGGQTHLQELFELLEELEPGGKTALAEVLHTAAETAGGRGITVLFSDLWEEPDEVVDGLRHLRFKGHEVLVFQVLDPAELEFPYRELTDFKDLESEERLQVHAFAWREGYLRELRAFLDRMRHACSAARIEYHVTRTDHAFELYLSRYLHARSRRRRG